MRIHDDWRGLPADARGASIAMGNFDGVHHGHRAVIDTARNAAMGAPLGIVTFEPHPRQYFDPNGKPFRLMNAQSRANRLARLGVDHLYQLPFDSVMAGLSPNDFARDVLVDGLGVRNVTIGADFRFGKDRAGTAQTLADLGSELGFGVTIADLIAHEGVEYSSTAIRDLLAQGKCRDAGQMLGHWHRIDGEVIHGEKRGRELGYPTANMALDGLHLPKLGIYAVLVDVLTGPNTGSYHGVASLGIRPMFDGDQPNLETFIFDFSGDLYGQQLSVALVDYLRPELKLPNLDALIEQMDRDSAQARAILAKL